MTKRDVSFDVAKAVAMILVVFVHVWTYAPVPADCRDPIWLNNFAMIASLPPFLMLSGMFSRRLFDELSVKRLALRLIACLWPVVTMIALAGIVLRLVMGGNVVPPGGVVSSVLSGGWFFFCLALCEVMTFTAHFISQGRAWLRMVVLAFGYVVLWALPCGFFHAVEMLPFFWFGAYALPCLRESRYGIAAGLASLAVLLAACFAVGDFVEAGLLFHMTSMGLLSFSWHGLLLMVGRIALGLLGGLGLITLVRVVVSRFRMLERLSWFGTQTMGIFFIHIYLLLVYYFLIGRACGGFAGRMVLTCAIFAISHGLAVLSRRNAIVSAVLWNPMELVRLKDKRREAAQ